MINKDDKQKIQIIKSVDAIITTPDGKQINLGNLNKKFKPRLWYYKFVTYPRRMKQLSKESA